MSATTGPEFSDPEIQASIRGNVSGQVLVGNNNLQFGSVSGGIINVSMATARRSPLARDLPVLWRPRPFPGLIDRQSEVATATAALLAGEPVELSGEEGIGKTTILRAVAHHPTSGAFRDGVVWLRAGSLPASDVLQVLFDAFYEWDAPTKPTDGELRQALGSKQALVLCDDIGFTRDDLEGILDSAPGCTFIVASPDRKIWHLGRSLSVQGLPLAEALVLLERELGRTLEPEEQSAAQAFVSALGGHPLRLLQAAALAREQGRSLSDIAGLLGSDTSPEAIVNGVVSTLPLAQRRVLSVLAALSGGPVGASHVGAIADVHDPEPVLQVLVSRHLASHDGGGYRAAGMMGSERTLDLDQVRERALAHFVSWAEESRRTPERIVEETGTLLRLIRWAAATGRRSDVVRLGRAIDGAMAVGMRWGAWSEVLGSVLQAARELGHKADEAWALHELGTRAGSLGHLPAAHSALSAALRIREALGDRAGVAATKHNHNVLFGAPISPPEVPDHQPITRPVPARPLRLVTVPATEKAGAPFSLLLVVTLTIAILGVGAWRALAVDKGVENDPPEATRVTATEAPTSRTGGAVPPTEIRIDPPTPTPPDSDRDGVIDVEDNCVAIFNPDQKNEDGDEFGDACEPDRDADLIIDDRDNCADVPNPLQENEDGDEFGDACEPDRDGDTVIDDKDNCVSVANGNQQDTDSDGSGDACDPVCEQAPDPDQGDVGTFDCEQVPPDIPESFPRWTEPVADPNQPLAPTQESVVQ